MKRFYQLDPLNPLAWDKLQEIADYWQTSRPRLAAAIKNPTYRLAAIGRVHIFAAPDWCRCIADTMGFIDSDTAQESLARGIWILQMGILQTDNGNAFTEFGRAFPGRVFAQTGFMNCFLPDAPTPDGYIPYL